MSYETFTLTVEYLIHLAGAFKCYGFYFHLHAASCTECTVLYHTSYTMQVFE